MAKTGRIDFDRWFRETEMQRTPWGDEDSPALVVAAETALERRLSVAIIDGKPAFRRLETGEVLVEQGDTGTDVYLLFDGVLMVEIDGNPVTELGPGAVVGEMALLEGQAHGHPAGGHPLPDRRGRRRPARPRRPRGGGSGPPGAGRLTMAAAVPRRATLRVAVWAFHLVLPLLGLWLLPSPTSTSVLEHHGIHFGLVVAVAAVNVALGVRMSEVSRRRADARLFLVSLVFLSSAGFLLLHALATPQVLLTGRNAGFAIATPVGLLLAAVFAAVSSIDLTPERADAVLRRQALLRGGLLALMVAWAVVSLFGLPPLDPLPEEASRGPAVMAVAGVALYALASVRYWRLYRRRPAVILIAVLTAFALLAEAMVAVALARNWHASWWEWHLLMAFAFAFVYYSAHVQYARGLLVQPVPRHLPPGDDPADPPRARAALEALVEAMQQPQGNGARPLGRVVADLADRFDLTEGQAQVLEQAAQALVAEREQIQRLRALVAVGAEAKVIMDERQLLERGRADRAGAAAGHAAGRPGRGRAAGVPGVDAGRGLAEQAGNDEQPADDGGDPCGASLKSLEPVEEEEGGGGRLVLPLTVKDRPAGVLDVRRSEGSFADRDRWLLRALASQLSIGLENARLYRQLDGLFRQYMSPDVATALLADPPRPPSAARWPRSRCSSPTCAASRRSPSGPRPTGWWACSTSISAGPCRCCWPTGARSSSSSATRSWPCSTRRPASPTTPSARPGRPWACRRRSRRSPSARPTGPGSGSASTPAPP